MPLHVLAHYRGTLYDMALQHDASAPIVLQDSEEAFEVFFRAMTTPLISCLFGANPDLSTVLDVFSLAHKYRVAPLRERTLPLAITLTSPAALIQRLSLPSSPSLERILQVGGETGAKAIVENAVEVIVNASAYEHDSWVHVRPWIANSVLLDLADRFCAPWPQIAARLYYYVMQRNPAGSWGRDAALTMAQRATLGVGCGSCADALDQFKRKLRTEPGTLKRCGKGGQCGCGFMLAELEKSQRPCYDILGRLDAASKIPFTAYPEPSCHSALVQLIRRQLVSERDRLTDYFQLVPGFV